MKKLMVLVFGVLALSSCSTRYNYYVAALNRTNLSTYRTFAWMPPATGATPVTMSVVDTKIKDAAAEALTQKGLTLQPQNADLLVSYSKVEGRGSRTNYYPMYVGGGFYPGLGWGWGGLGWGGFGWGGYGWGGWYNPYFYAPSYYAGTAVQREHYKEGTLVIDLIDRRSRQVVWRGFGVGEVRNNQQKDIDDLPKVVSGIFEQLSLAPSSAPPAGGRGIN